MPRATSPLTLPINATPTAPNITTTERAGPRVVGVEDQAELIDARPGESAELPSFLDVTDAHSQFFADEREGADRWGRERKRLTTCATGWDDYVCPAYREESRPATRNPGDRPAPS